MNDVESVVIATGCGTYSLELLPAFGGIANRLSHVDAAGKRTELIAGCGTRAALEQDRHFRGTALWPFVNRLDGGSYHHLNQLYSFPVNEPAFNNALHGFLFALVPEVKLLAATGTDAAVALHYRYQGTNPAYPFPAEIILHFLLQADTGLTVSFEVRNLHQAAVPLGIGWHPYLALGQPVDELLLQLPPVQRVEVDARMLPTGIKSAFNRFARPARLAGVQLNDCMMLREAAAERVSCHLSSPATGRGVELWQMAGEYPYLQVFIPPDRQSIALEPVSCGINAFNTGEGLRLLEPQQVFSARCGVRMIVPGSSKD